MIMDETTKQETPASESTRGTRKTRVGEVISSGMNKTIVVRTVTRVPHAKFGKIVKQQKKFYAHDEENKAKIGRHRADHGNPPAEQIEALASGRSRPEGERTYGLPEIKIGRGR